MFTKLKAFTMAEAILVMTILGIIATIMISTLKPAEYKEKSMQIMAKKVLSEIDVATTQIIMNNTVDGTFDTLMQPGSSNILNIDDYGLAELRNGLADLYKTYLTAIRKTPEATIGAKKILLKDGAALGFIFLPRSGQPCSGTIFPGEIEQSNTSSECYGSIQFDINDNEPPNVYGKDRFILPLGKYGIMYAD